MEKGAAVMTVAILLLAGVSVAIYSGNALSDTKGVEYSITYVLNGGDNAAENPSSYLSGKGTELVDPHRTGYIFLGWYSDEALTHSVDRISASDSGDKTLYAGWERSFVGTKLSFSITGSYIIRQFIHMNVYTNTVNLGGSVSYSYLSFAEDRGYLMNYEKSLYNTADPEHPSTDTDTYWSSESGDDTVWTITGTETISTERFGEKTCYVYVGTTATSRETQYIGVDDMIPYKMSFIKQTWSVIRTETYSFEYTLQSVGIVETKDKCDVVVYCDKGVQVSGAGTKDSYTSVTLTAETAEGTAFKGWYSSEMGLLSTSKTYIIDILLVDYTLYALNTNEPDLVFDTRTVHIESDVPLTDVTWTFEDGGEPKIVHSNVLDYTFSESGLYRIDYDGTAASGGRYYGTLTVTNGAIEKSFTWTYDSTQYHYDMYIKYSDYMTYKNKNVSRSQGSNEHDLQFITYGDPYVVSLANALNSMTSTFDDKQKATFILNFVQAIEYQYDIDSAGRDEYWKYPVETLYDQCGDCEDTSILYCAIMKALGYDTSLILLNGHAMSGLSMGDGWEGTALSGCYSTASNGHRYYYCETTTTGWDIGDPLYNDLKVQKVIPVV